MHGEEGDDAAYDLGTADHQRPDGTPTKATARGAIDRFTIWPTVRLTIPERGLYTGVAIFGAVGSGKTSACMHPFARQLLSWQATNPERRAAALVLEVRGDSCHDIRRMLTELDRGEDYIELSLDGRLTWNPLSATWLDSYSLSTARARDPAPSGLSRCRAGGKTCATSARISSQSQKKWTKAARSGSLDGRRPRRL